MAITQKELGRRLKAARKNRGRTQEEVAGQLEIPRTAVVEIEAGRRAVGSLELSKLALLYGRAVEDFLRAEGFDEDPVLALFRATPQAAEDHAFVEALHEQARLCRQAHRLERLLGWGTGSSLAMSYSLDPPATRWDAVCQGRWLAGQERRRLDLGVSSLRGIAEVLRGEGVRVAEVPMPDEVSGVFLHGRELGSVVLINTDHPRVRRLFSCAHEYCHLLADRDRPGGISRRSMCEELWEVRANAFATHFLMPEEGVRSALRSLGKGLASRHVHEVYGNEVHGNEAEGGEGAASFVAEAVPVHKRLPTGSQEIQVHDVVAVAHRFGVSYLAALFHLRNLKLVTKDRFETLQAREEAARKLRRALWKQTEEEEEEERWTLAQQILTLALEAHRREEISRRKLLQFSEELGVSREDLEAVLEAEGCRDEPVDVHEPR